MIPCFTKGKTLNPKAHSQVTKHIKNEARSVACSIWAELPIHTKCAYVTYEKMFINLCLIEQLKFDLKKVLLGIFF